MTTPGAVMRLVAARRLEVVPADRVTAITRLERAVEKLETAKSIVEIEMLTQEQAHERMGVQNVGDFERVARTVSGVALLAAASSVPRTLRVPLGLIGAVAALSGVSGWCPVYHYARVTSLGGPGDRPDEATRNEWLAERPGGPAVPSAHEEAV